MKKKLGCLFIPVVLFVIVGIISLVTIFATDNVEDEIFTIADTADYTISYNMNTESGLFLDATGKTDQAYIVELTMVKSGDTELRATSSGSGETPNQTGIRMEISEQREADTEEQYIERNIKLQRSEIIADMRTDSRLVFSLEAPDGEPMPDLIGNTIEGTLIVYTYDEATGEFTEVGQHAFTKDAGIDGQI